MGFRFGGWVWVLAWNFSLSLKVCAWGLDFQFGVMFKFEIDVLVYFLSLEFGFCLGFGLGLSFGACLE